MNEIRISLQDKEKELLNRFIVATTFDDIADGIDKLVTFENLYVIVTVIEIITGKEILPGTPNDIYDIIDAVREGGSDLRSWFFEDFWDVDLKADWERFFGGSS